MKFSQEILNAVDKLEGITINYYNDDAGDECYIRLNPGYSNEQSVYSLEDLFEKVYELGKLKGKEERSEEIGKILGVRNERF